MATKFAPDSFEMVSVSPISDQVKRLQVISCDVCNEGMASFDVFIAGVVSEVSVLKRCCDKCVKNFSR